MISFVPAQQLKEIYAILGNFYSVEIAAGVEIQCRNVLEIVPQPLDFSEIRKWPERKPDAVFVMMNPGSSQPLIQVNQHVGLDSIGKIAISLVPTKPDTTQYQVMRVMQRFNLRHVRVLNLSDLRCTKSPLFIKQFRELEAEYHFDAHSIFSDSRQAELEKQLLQYKDITVVRAWGVSPHLDPLIDRCEKRLKSIKKLSGLLKEGTANKYLHPLPSLQKQQELWFQRIVELWGQQF